MNTMNRILVWSSVILLAAVAHPADADQTDTEKPDSQSADVQPADDKVLEGHSYHGEAFDQGPRQAAYLMAGTGNVSFPVTTRNPLAQKFFNQGIGQLHGFWYFEAERSFRQAAALDSDCAMAYWGMAMANANNSKRAANFIAEAVKRRDKAGKREQMWIDAWSAFHKADVKKDKERREALVKAIENIIHEYPEDIEAKAALALQLWLNRGPIPLNSREAVDAVIEQVLTANPMHPIHHYRIHLWDDATKAAQAVKSASLNGQASPGVAHQWHMPGHTFSKLQRYADAAWQQEAASRVDHAYMMRDFVLPDQIHNYAHNHEWLIRDLSHIGRARYGLELAKNLVEMPRHPKHNLPTKSGSANYGRARLIEVLQRYELWNEAVALSQTSYFEPTDVPREQVKRLRLLGAAYHELGDVAKADAIQSELADLLAKEKAAQKTAGDKAAADPVKKQPAKPAVSPTASSTGNATAQKPKPTTSAATTAKSTTAATTTTTSSTAATTTAKPAPAATDPVAKARQTAENPFRTQIALLEAALAELKGRTALKAEQYDTALAEFKKAGITSGEFLSRVQLAADQKEAAEKTARDAVQKNAKQVVPLANLVHVLWELGKRDEATKSFTELRTLAAVADLDVPAFARIAPIAAELNWPADWRTPAATGSDVGIRPPLDSLGPIRWSPSPAPPLELTALDGRTISLSAYRGRNVVFLFYLGFGCLHCTEQLKTFAPLTEEFATAGIDIVAVATDSAAVLREAEAALSAEEKYPFPIVPNDDLSVFKRYRAYDDFERLPLHATVLVDAEGRIRWLDVGADPFSDAKFLLGEAKRLLSFNRPAAAATARVESGE